MVVIKEFVRLRVLECWIVFVFLCIFCCLFIIGLEGCVVFVRF